MNAIEALSALERLKEAIADHISRLPVDERLQSIEKQIKFAMEDENHPLAIRHLNNMIDLLIIKIKDKHCDDSK